jgi:hypothetical protein
VATDLKLLRNLHAEEPMQQKKFHRFAWQHIKLQGRYEFQKQPDPLDVDMIIRTLTEISVSR